MPAGSDSLVSAIEAARRTLDISSPTPAGLLFQTEITTALSGFVRRTRQARLRLLIGPGTLQERGSHRLLDLARRLDEQIQVRGLADTHREARYAFATWDGLGFHEFLDAESGTARHAPQAPARARQLAALFDRLWLGAVALPEFRQLRL